MIDLGRLTAITRTELFLYRPTLGHAYRLEASRDGRRWEPVAEHAERRICAPQVDRMETTTRYLRWTFRDGNPGVWEMRIFGKD